MTLEEYWRKTGKNKKFIRRNINDKGKNLGVEHWVAPADGILINSNWSDILASKSTGVDVPFESPKNCDLIILLNKLAGTKEYDIILDFFSGSATTAHAVMDINAEDGGNRKYIMVQLPEPCDEKSEAYKAGYENIAEIGKERIRRAGKKIKEETGADIDYGFRVYKVDSWIYKETSRAKFPSKIYMNQAIADEILKDGFIMCPTLLLSKGCPWLLKADEVLILYHCFK